jgi:hypothetical protein
VKGSGVVELNAALADSGPDTVRRSRASYSEVIEKIAVVRRAIEDATRKRDEKDQAIERLKRILDGEA